MNRWAHAELGVALDLLTAVLEEKSMRVQPISNHHQHSGSGSVSADAGAAKGIFLKALEPTGTPYDVEILRRLLELRQAGWAISKGPGGWRVNYGHEQLMNLPLNPENTVDLCSDLSCDARPYNVLVARHSELGAATLSTELSGGSALLVNMMGSLDLALLARLSESDGAVNGNNLQLDSPGIGCVSFSLEAPPVDLMQQSPVLRTLLKMLYTRFITSRGRSVQ